MKKIMILGASVLQVPAIKESRNMGYEVLAVDMNPDAIGFQYAHKKIVVSTTDTLRVLQEAKKYNIDGIITIASDRPMKTVAKVCEDLNLIGINEKTAINATNKNCMRNALEKYNVDIPMYFSVNSYNDYINAVRKVKDSSYKCIVKPSDNSGSRGIKLIKSYNKLEIDEAYRHSKENSFSGQIMVEEYMEGPEVSVESLSINGECYIIQVTDKLTTGAPYFVEMGHSQPSSLPNNIIKSIKELTKKATKAIGVEEGPAHTEIKVTKEGPKIVEIGARLGGDNITTHLVLYSTGINMVKNTIKIALGEQVNINKEIDMCSAIKYKDCPEGIIKEISGINEAKKVSGVKDIEIVHDIGEKSKEIQSSNDRVAYVISQGKTLDDAINSCDTALNKIEVIVK